jgi:hypothetical protein
MDEFCEEFKIKMILVNKLLNEQNITSFKERKYAYIREMDKVKLNVDWDTEILAYYKSLPYHDEVNIMLGGKHVVIPKKTYDIEALNRKLQEKGLDPLLLGFMAAQKLNGGTT